ncbi:MAG: glutathione transferase GstA [Alphaproteobacteria bacterium]|nr:glutathione transferase GstA [Alphaproteobacteria bacterium]
MELYSSPMACSLASHITILEAGLPAKVTYVDTKAKRTDDGKDFLQIAPNGYVPALRLDNGEILNEGGSVLQYLADQKPERGLAPKWGTPARYQLIDALHYIATEVHKGIFHPILTTDAPADAKAEAQAALPKALDYMEKRLGKNQYFVGDTFTVVDAYLFVMLTWAAYVGADMKRWPALVAYYERLRQRPSVAKAFAEEFERFQKRAA